MIDSVRDCYGDVSILNRYDDNALAQMMLLDACFIINFMRICSTPEIAKQSYNCLGVAAALPFAARDIMVLENQIPFFVLELVLLQVSTNASTARILMKGFMIEMFSVDVQYALIPRESEVPPLHLLEACRRVLVEKLNPSQQNNGEVEAICRVELLSSDKYEFLKQLRGASKERTNNYITCPSVKYLKTKGIHCHPSLTHLLTDINFSSHSHSGKLQLPVWYASSLTFVFLSNMIAYEIAPGNHANDSPDLKVLSYVCLMKSLIQTTADVMELQNKGILRLNRFANHEQVVHMYKSLETFNLWDVNMYQKVMFEIGEHCTSKRKTWMADLIHLKFKNPWTVVALLSTTILLILNFLRTFFTIRPSR